MGLEESIVSDENILHIREHKCRKCHKVVCSILCSVHDPESDNEMHIISKHGDDRCITEYSSRQDLKFDCSKCEKE